MQIGNNLIWRTVKYSTINPKHQINNAHLNGSGTEFASVITGGGWGRDASVYAHVCARVWLLSRYSAAERSCNPVLVIPPFFYYFILKFVPCLAGTGSAGKTRLYKRPRFTFQLLARRTEEKLHLRARWPARGPAVKAVHRYPDVYVRGVFFVFEFESRYGVFEVTVTFGVNKTNPTNPLGRFTQEETRVQVMAVYFIASSSCLKQHVSVL